MGISPSLKASRFDKLTLFSFAWAVANILHALSFADRISPQHPFAVAVVLAAALVLLVPWSVWPFLLMLCCSVANTFEWMPYAPNHITFEFIVNSGILLTLTWSITRLYLRYKTTMAVETPATRNNLFNTFAPFVRISLFLLYFYAVLHKLNWDYFNLDISCSTFLLAGYANRIPFIPDNVLVRWSAVWGTIVIEAAIPLLLYFRKTRSAGLLLACGFHYFLALHPHPGLYSFSAMLFALYMLFLPDTLTATVQAFINNILSITQRRVLLLFQIMSFIGILLLITLKLVASNYINNIAHKLNLVGFFIWLTWGLLLIVVYSCISAKFNFKLEHYTSLFRVRHPVLWLVPLLILFNGLTPYLGIKTQTNFSMFSNLRTEGGVTNHLFIPLSIQIGNREKDLVEVTDTNFIGLQSLVDNQQLIPYFEFRRITSEAQTDFYATYIRGHQRQTMRVVDGVSNQPELLVAHNWLVAKFIRFRPVDKGPCLCKH